MAALPAAPAPAAASSTAAAATGPPPCAPLALRPALAAPAPGDIYLRPRDATCDAIRIEVAAHDVAGLFTASFDLRYPATLLEYQGYEPGPLVLKGAPRTKPFFLVRAATPGVLQVTLTRFAPDGAVTAEGSEAIVILKFGRVGKGSGAIDFDRAPESTLDERIVGERGEAVPARFGPGHGGTVDVP